jgi:hypothetical protein
MDDMIPPTADECSNHAEVHLGNGIAGRACWYPKMGGYVAKAVVVIDPSDCIDVYVWHDGDFPFDGHCQYCGEPRGPVVLHHCEPDDFVRFGEFLRGLTDG